MQLKTLEIAGFKSFPAKTKLSFGEGLTVVVGPNGCGKSNISDAIRWAIGEQSAKNLRGGKMEDVIFNGTEDRSALGVAEVSVTFCNKSKILPIEYDEVVITRRIYRSGESEYLINKNPVRLKDITELLAGTGVGVESYSILEQGKIDLILSSKPDERREIFEEASGISKFKSKKREALRKLEGTQNNLLRISDIMHELKRQINSIERHARRAERYKKFFDELKALEVKKAFYEYTNLSKDASHSASEIEQIKGKQSDFATQIQDGKRSFAEKDILCEELQREIEKIQRHITECASEIDKKEYTKKTNAERKQEILRSNEILQKELSEAERKIDIASREEKSLDVQLQEEKQKKNSQDELTLNAKKKVDGVTLEIDSIVERLTNLSNEHDEVSNYVTGLKNDLTKLNADSNNAKMRLEKLVSDSSHIDGEMVRVRGEYKHVGQKLNEKELERQSIEVKEESLVAQFEDIAKKITTAAEDGKGAEENLLLLRSKIKALEEFISHGEGLLGSAKELLENIKSSNAPSEGFCGLLCDLFNVSTGYERAVEVALGGLLQSFVFKTTSQRDAFYEYAREKKYDAVNCIALDQIFAKADDAGKQDAAQHEINKQYEPFASLVECADEYKGLINHLFSGHFVVKNVRENDGFLKENTHAVCITPDKEFERLASLQTPPQDASAYTLVGRYARMDQMREETLLLDKRMADIMSTRQHLESQKSNCEESIFSTRRMLQKVQIELAQFQTQKENIEKELAWVSNEEKIIRKESDELTSVVDANDVSRVRFSDKIKELESRLSEISSEKNTLQDSLTAKNKLRDTALVESTKLYSVMDSMQETVSRLEGHIEKIRLHREDISGRVQNVKTTLANNAIKLDTLAQSEITLQKEIIEQNEEITSSKKVFQEKVQEKQQTHSQSDEIRKSVEQLERTLHTLKDQQHDINIRENNLSFERQSIAQRIRQIYKVDIEQEKPVIEDAIDWDNVKTRIDELSAKVEKMGTVNLVAIDEHNELKERHSFMTEQYDDLVQAKEALQKTIRKINATTREMFMETFTKVRDEFKNYFRQLFGGGQADVRLVDESDVLDSGIDIFARPPGKKLQNITLLSGGEKALTAIALLFAIFKSRPSPFCIMDELDAPLDETNIDRFSTALSEFLKESQFIIITHNRKTIQLADVIYGVTMEEKGVSKIVSVRFTDEAAAEKAKLTTA